MTETPYPSFVNPDIDVEDIRQHLQEMSRLRDDEDIPNFFNLDARFVSGRRTERIPSSSADVIATDNEGDIVYSVDGNTMYVLVNASGSLAWRSVTLASF